MCFCTVFSLLRKDWEFFSLNPSIFETKRLDSKSSQQSSLVVVVSLFTQRTRSLEGHLEFVFTLFSQENRLSA